MSSSQELDARPVLSVRDISKRFGGVLALDGVSIDLLPGEVHCIAGENGCGKSTLIKVIAGAERPDRGEIIVDGVSHAKMNTTSAITTGIQVIYQDFSLFPNLSVGENIVLTSAVAARQKIYRARASRPRARAIIDELGLDLDLDDELGELSVADRQLTAICRALVNEARIIIMDEPTTALTHTEVARLFAVVEKLSARGVSLVFVSHKLDEVLTISDRLTIMRSGRVIATGATSDFTRSSIAETMTGRELDESRAVSELPGEGRTRLQVDGLTLTGAFQDISFTVRSGEILGITGLLGSGRTEIAEAIFGVRPAEEGTIHVDGVQVLIRTIADAITAGIGYVPEDRLTQGLFLEKPIADNIVASSLDSCRTPWRTLDRRRITATIDRLFSGLRINAPTSAAPVRSLSGGNAQRVVLAKWLATHPKILILNGPTVGVDVGSKSQILDLLRAEAAEGMAVIVISDDATELVSCCHRVLVVGKGHLSHELTDGDITVETIQERMAA
ncbi:sugar ABC transporter ATP-binding protein [Microbacterium murale]|uniref:Sugar ABC transporter ATP-binding protein n=1 Tax=Microbacterium murale TaxID=1081040 RepID=A0ABQ1RJK7_9MICO|nr:sugar ABC transporter ATP-binding protein [Microbacterium murale]GGD69130.1 sugar ABC transporter ATP-binding protein [Microbacterium murale]